MGRDNNTPIQDAEEVFNLFRDLEDEAQERIARVLFELEGDVYASMTEGRFWTSDQIRATAQALLTMEKAIAG
jgi:hypothetical protein